jgi:hypothetical protein
MIKRVLVYLIIGVFTLPVLAQKGEITSRDLKEYVYFLASDSLKGRKPGTPEMKVAAKYILDHFKSAGLKPMGDKGFQYFDVVTDVNLGKNNKLSVDGFDAGFKKDFIPLAFSASGDVNAPVVFAGYGFDLDLDSLKWNDYTGADVKGKWVMVFRADPELDKSDSRFIPFNDARSKVLTAKDKGAAGVLLITPGGLDKDDKLMNLVVENNEVTSGIPVINITHEISNRILRLKGVSADSLERLISSTKKPLNFETGISVHGLVDIAQTYAKTANVVGLLEGHDKLLRNEYIVVGAHYDHLGFGGQGSGSRMPDTIAIHNGADDNASGTALVMDLAKKLSAQKKKLKRSVIFIAFSGEEMGLLGSKYFVNHPLVDIKKIKAMFNFDMVGRYNKEKNSISISGTGTSLEADTILRLLEKGLPFLVTHSPDGYGPSDHASFYAANIPVFF